MLKYIEKNNSEKAKNSTAKYRRNNIEKSREYTRNWNRNNRERIKNNPKYKYYRSISDLKRRNAEKLATPKWLSETMKLQINDIYKECTRLSRENSIKYHVDHIIPLKGKEVCGLHVPWNLQILSADENLKKGNKLL